MLTTINVSSSIQCLDLIRLMEKNTQPNMQKPKTKVTRSQSNPTQSDLRKVSSQNANLTKILDTLKPTPVTKRQKFAQDRVIDVKMHLHMFKVFQLH